LERVGGRAYLMVATTILSRESWFPMLAAGDEAGYVCLNEGKLLMAQRGLAIWVGCAERVVGRGDATRRESTI
jgi:hypothetical protein